MPKKVLLSVVLCGLVILAGCATQKTAEKKESIRQYVETDTGRWLIHDMNRPRPTVVTPGKVPSDSVLLFGGSDPNLSGLTDMKGGDSKWIVRDDYMESVKGAGYIRTKREFGSCQLHVEFRTPVPVKGSGQGRGNSGVFLMGEYEVQVLDSYTEDNYEDNKTYADGQCAALYGREVPQVNASAKPGEWQSYDIIFHRPIFAGGKVVRRAKATFTVLHNGVLVHDDVELQGGTGWKGPHAISDYEPHGDTGPIALQDHGNPVRYRNIWIREIDD